MLRRKVRGYDSFRCIAGDCPQTCCAGWLIEIDDEALEGYQKDDNGKFDVDYTNRGGTTARGVICIVTWARTAFV